MPPTSLASSPSSVPVAAPLLGLLLLAAVAPTADAVLLWKRKRDGGAGGVPARAVSAPPVDVAATQPAAQPAMQPASPDVPGAGGSLAEQIANTLGAPLDVPPPGFAAAYPHQRRALQTPWERLLGTDGDADLALALLDYGNALARVGNDGGAARAYAEAVALDPDARAAWNNLGALARRGHHHGLARQVFEERLARDERDGLAWFNLALTLDEMRLFDESDDAYVAALRLEPALWLPVQNPLIVGNERARRALHHNYLRRGAGGSIYLEAAR